MPSLRPWLGTTSAELAALAAPSAHWDNETPLALIWADGGTRRLGPSSGLSRTLKSVHVALLVKNKTGDVANITHRGYQRRDPLGLQCLGDVVVGDIGIV